MIIKEETVLLPKDKEMGGGLDSIYKNICKNSIYFDLEHYVYKKPKCVGVFGACTFSNGNLLVTQYMIEKSEDIKEILLLGKRYFKDMEDKKYIVTFSGNNDFSVINYLFEKYDINYNIFEKYISIDIQKEYEKVRETSIGLKALEKQFNINRDSQLISGSTLAKTFSKIMKDDSYIERMPGKKIEKILLYNKQDVVSLYEICKNWDKYINNIIENTAF